MLASPENNPRIWRHLTAL